MMTQISSLCRVLSTHHNQTSFCESLLSQNSPKRFLSVSVNTDINLNSILDVDVWPVPSYTVRVTASTNPKLNRRIETM